MRMATILIVLLGLTFPGAVTADADGRAPVMRDNLLPEGSWNDHFLAVMQDVPPTGQEDEEPGDRQATPEDMENRRRHMEQFRTLKLLELLDLGEDQEMEFLILFRSVRRTLHDLDRKKDTLLEQLATGIREQRLDDRRIDRLIDEVLEAEDSKREALKRFLVEARELLSSEQVGKLVVFHERFEFELLKAVRGFKGRHGAGGFGPRGGAGENGRQRGNRF